MRVLAALSGGVDSAYAAYCAKQMGHEVTAVHMALSLKSTSCTTAGKGCCTIEDANDAARVADSLDIPFYVWDLAKEFEEKVVNDFISEYSRGFTPNPCVRCNEFVKFRELLNRAELLGFDAVCTGHYARILEGKAGLELHRARFLEKDQSYVLAVMGKESLGKILLPLGEVSSKQWVRKKTEELGLIVSNKPDSYDICFIPDGNTQGFLESHIGVKPGKIFDTHGNLVGSHRGYYRFTVGQRKGIGLGHAPADGRPRYVLNISPVDNSIVVGNSDSMQVDRLFASDLGFLGDYTVSDEVAGTNLPFLRDVDGYSNCTEQEIHFAPSSSESEKVCLTAQTSAHGTARKVQSVYLIYRNQTRSDCSLSNSTNLNCNEAIGLTNSSNSPLDHCNSSPNDVLLQVVFDQPLRRVAPGQSLVLYQGTRVVAHARVTPHQSTPVPGNLSTARC